MRLTNVAVIWSGSMIFKAFLTFLNLRPHA